MVRAARAIAVEAILAGGVIGILEGVRVISDGPGGGLAAWGVVAALAAVGAIAVALAIDVASRLVARAPAVQRWIGDLGAGGERRVHAVGNAGVAIAAVLAFGVAVFRFAAWAHEVFRFNDAGPVALLLAVGSAALAVVTLVLGSLARRVLVPRLARHTGLFDGRGVWIAIVLAIVVIGFVPAVIVRLAVPAVDPDPVWSGALLVLAVLATRALGVGVVRGASGLRVAVAAAALAAGALAGTALIGESEQARGAVVVHGTFSKVVARALWHLADRDGDGYPPAWIGGADCEDGDPARSPGRREVAGNGIDDNCGGGDASAADLVRPGLPASGGPRRNIVVISVDALRADHLGAWGYERRTSPAIDAFSAGAVRFAWAMTASPSTRHALPALFTGRHPSTIDRRTPPPSFAEVARAAGYETAAVLCCQRLVAPRELRGFTTVDTSADATRMSRAGQANADAVADATIAWLQRPHDQPFLLWVHLYDPHHPYAPPPGSPDFGSAEIDRYDAEIAFADRGIGRVLAAIDAAGLAATSVVAVTSDHGDEFGEHGLRFHARSLFNQVARVPLIVRAPDSRPSVIEQPVSLVDVAPTLYELAGLGGPPGMNGRSLATAVRGTAAPAARPVLLELVPDRQIARDLAGILTADHKAIWDREANAWSLFARSDPDDLHDLAAAEPVTLAACKQELFEALDRELATAPGTPARP